MSLHIIPFEDLYVRIKKEKSVFPGIYDAEFCTFDSKEEAEAAINNRSGEYRYDTVENYLCDLEASGY